MRRTLLRLWRRSAVRRQRDLEWLARTSETELEVFCEVCSSSVMVRETICPEDMGYRWHPDGYWDRPRDLLNGWAKDAPQP